MSNNQSQVAALNHFIEQSISQGQIQALVRLNTYLRRYISPLITRELFYQEKLPILLNQQETPTITALVLDMRGFVRTTRSGELTSQGLDAVAQLMRIFFSRIIRIAFEYKGLVGEFAGDRVMITFGFPPSSMFTSDPTDIKDDLPLSIQQAVSTALAIQDMSDKLKQDNTFPEELRKFEVGIGICAGGPAWIGDIGTNHHLHDEDSWRQELTLISTAINIAARAEELTKRDDLLASAPTKKIIINGDIFDQIRSKAKPHEYSINKLDKVADVRGLREKVNLFHLIEMSENILLSPQPIREEDKQVVNWISEHIDGAIERESVSNIHHSLSNIGTIIASEKTIEEDQVLGQIMIQIVESFKAQKATLYLIDPNTQQLMVKAYEGPELPFTYLPPGTGIVGKVARNGEPISIADVHTDERWSGKKADPTIHSMMCVPLKLKNTIIGVIQVMDDKIGRYRRTDLSSLEIFAGLATVALDNVQTYRQSMQMATARTKITEALSNALTLDQVLDVVMEAVEEALSARNATLYEVDFDTGNLIFKKIISDSEDAPEEGESLPKGRGIVGHVVDNKSSLLVANTHTDPHWYGAMGGRDIFSIICVPLLSKGLVVGAIQVLDQQPNFFNQEHLSMLEWLAASAAVAIDHASQLEQARRKLIASDTIAGMGAIAGKLAHNLKNHVTAIKFIAKNRLKDNEKSKQRILEAADKALDEVKSFMQPLQQDLKPTEFDLNTIVSNVIDEAKEIINKRAKADQPKANVQINYDLFEGELIINAVRGQVHYIFYNLIDNAIQAIDDTGEKEGIITLKTSIEQVNDIERALVTVTDTGKGIKKENIERIFSQTFTTRPEGTVGGYGLFSVRLSVEKLGGRIFASSNPGSGATFQVRLPCVSKLTELGD